ncbi:Putative dye-decolorizing peroxidase (DyP), YfeX-like subgroup [Photobacterium marinum]|uniref:Putative dye-decolorizing peroxidase (DyP), YfeX-like subgroup n=1 Tax=Photobacterium marinum TaxID=1056511 RepID=L8J8F1_9GAMM|nr:Dyp-type peroxidase [Photobacterium marinum]ELR65155.1 Putative dye-decolorizing peroxidase (DyP), YfeX-like subgroup [Photobacterium marinum]
MAIAQPAILPEAGPFALYVVMKVTGDKQAVIKQCQELHNVLAQVNEQQPGASLRASIAFGKSFWLSLEKGCPAGFDDFRQLGSGDTTAPATGGDILLHVNSSRHDLNFYTLRQFLQPIAQEVEVMDETYGYKYLDARDMTDFIDGTENPKTEESRRNVALIADGEFAGGSFVMVQRFIHNLPAWNKMAVEAQEKVIGRTKPDSVELEDVPADSHVGRVDIKEEGKGLKIVRHSLPYGSVTGDHGLLFIAYCNTQHNFNAMLESMYGETDGTVDQLLRFTRAVNGAYFFAPSKEVLESL